MSNFKIGYARVSTNTQDEALQLDALSSSRLGRRSDLESGRDALVGLTDASCCLLPLRCAALR